MTQSPAQKFGGILSALVTPYRADFNLNEDIIAGLIDHELGQGVAGFYVGGSTGEAFLQSPEERGRLIAAVARAARGRGTLIAHVGTIATEDTLSIARSAADAGFDAVSAIPPFYYDFSAAELIAHYKALAAATPLPVIVYNFGGRTGKLGPNEILQLLDDPRVIGIKHTSQDFFQLERFKTHRPDAVIYNGYDEMCLGGLAMGADGAIGTHLQLHGPSLRRTLQGLPGRSHGRRARPAEARESRHRSPDRRRRVPGHQGLPEASGLRLRRMPRALPPARGQGLAEARGLRRRVPARLSRTRDRGARPPPRAGSGLGWGGARMLCHSRRPVESAGTGIREHGACVGGTENVRGFRVRRSASETQRLICTG
ncbi:N-acetylneuraminate lyase [Hyphomicrobiales bacterium]|nr:N-acetylneuraminate lyase [Hyphomicrobiales bacterium]